MDQNDKYKREIKSKIKSKDECDEIMRKIEEQCKTHKYFKEFVVDELEKILNGDAKRCDVCLKWNFNDNAECLNCNEQTDKSNRKDIGNIEKKSKVKRKCKGMHKKGIPCNRVVDETHDYCKPHEYFKELSVDEIYKIKNGLAKPCDYCPKFHFGANKRCSECATYCSIKQKERKAKVVKCIGISRNNTQCDNKPTNNTKYCNFHQYMVNYTDEQISQMIICSTCKMCKYNEIDKETNDHYKTCAKCRTRGEVVRNEYKENKIICIGFIKGNPCHFEALENGYCGNHQRQKKQIAIESDGVYRVCSNYIRGCVSILDTNNKYKYCNDCRKYGRETTNPVTYHKKSSANRNISLELTDEEIKGLVKQNCYYCNGMNDRGWNGIDRTDNTGDYTINNTTPCCKICNVMKYVNTEFDFINYCKNIYENHPCNNIFENPQLVKHNTFNGYKNSARVRGIEFELTENDFNDILLKKCFYCNNTNLSNQIGIDRLINDQSYNIYNIVPCCKVCNRMKHINNYIPFIEKINKIIENKKNENKTI